MMFKKVFVATAIAGTLGLAVAGSAEARGFHGGGGGFHRGGFHGGGFRHSGFRHRGYGWGPRYVGYYGGCYVRPAVNVFGEVVARRVCY